MGRKAIWLTLAVLGCSTLASAGTIVRFETNLGDFDIELYNGAAPITCMNFMRYVKEDAYDNSFFHRSHKSGINIVQGGGYYFEPGDPTAYAVPQHAMIPNEYRIPNDAGTIAMAKLGSGPDTATSQWFFNIEDNAPLDDTLNNGGYTVFGRVISGWDILSNPSMAPLPGIADLDAYDLSGGDAYSPFGEVPLFYDGSQYYYAMVMDVYAVPEPATLALLGLGAVALLRRRR